jgi:pyruvate dehydrogenase E2 component (dihydrolipoamide acetyltransferase)
MLAEELGVNLEKVVGTGPAGKITEEDVRNAAASKPAKKGPSVDTEHKLGQTIPLNRMQKVIAQRMLRSKLEIPCFYLTVTADMTKLVDYRTERNKTAEVKIAYNDFLVKAVATGLENFPIMTGQLKDNNIQLPESVGVGLAISVPGGLVAPIVKDAHKKNIIEIAKYTQGLVEKARNNKLSPDDMDGGCITVSSLGAFGIDSFIPIVVPGQCSIMGIGQIADTCVPNGGNIVIRKLMAMTLSVDHKVANGAYAAQFLDYVRKILEDPTNFE